MSHFLVVHVLDPLLFFCSAVAVPPNPRKIFVGNIPPKTTAEDLRTLFANLGDLAADSTK